MENMMLYMIDTLASDFNNVKNMMLDTIDKGKGKWFNAIEEYRLELKISWDDLKKIERPALKRMIKDYDTAKWEEGMIRKTSMRYYIKEKKPYNMNFAIKIIRIQCSMREQELTP